MNDRSYFAFVQNKEMAQIDAIPGTSHARSYTGAAAPGVMQHVTIPGSESAITRVIGHGMWAGARITALIGTRLPGTGTRYLGQSLKFQAPVRVGDTLSIDVTVTAHEADSAGCGRTATPPRSAPSCQHAPRGRNADEGQPA